MHEQVRSGLPYSAVSLAKLADPLFHSGRIIRPYDSARKQSTVLETDHEYLQLSGEKKVLFRRR